MMVSGGAECIVGGRDEGSGPVEKNGMKRSHILFLYYVF